MNTVNDLEQAIINRDKAEEELLKAIREDARIAENMKDYWKHLNSGAEGV